MASIISPKAEVSPKAKIGDNCKIYPFAYIEDDVVIGDNCIIYPYVSILNGTRMGSGNQVFQYTALASLPQDYEFAGEESLLTIGDNNIIRENVVLNRATHADGKTVVGNNNVLMEGSHISHDSTLGDCSVLGYSVKIAGNCTVGSHTIFSSGVIQHRGSNVGDAVMIQSGTSFGRNVPPYVVVSPEGTYNGVNAVMCRKLGFSDKVIKHIANAYRLVFHSQTSLFDAIIQIREQVPDSEEIRSVIAFLESSSKGLIGKQ